MPEIDAGLVGGRQRLADEERVPILRSPGPARERPIAALARCPDQPVLLHHVDALLEPEQIRLEDAHVGED